MKFIETNEAKYLDIKKSPSKEGLSNDNYLFASLAGSFCANMVLYVCFNSATCCLNFFRLFPFRFSPAGDLIHNGLTRRPFLTTS